MGESKSFASLSSGLLARKGAAKPAMRRPAPGFGHGAADQDDLGWNDMGYDVDPDMSADDDKNYRHNPLMGAVPDADANTRARQQEIAGQLMAAPEPVELAHAHPVPSDEDLAQAAAEAEHALGSMQERHDLAGPRDPEGQTSEFYAPEPHAPETFGPEPHAAESNASETSGPVFQEPASQEPASQEPASQQPASMEPAFQEPVSGAPVPQESVARDVSTEADGPGAAEARPRVMRLVGNETPVSADAQDAAPVPVPIPSLLARKPDQLRTAPDLTPAKPVRRKPRAETARLPAKDKTAFTLRLDAERHLRLRLACAVHNVSAQKLVTTALDELLASMPDIAELSRHLPRRPS